MNEYYLIPIVNGNNLITFQNMLHVYPYVDYYLLSILFVESTKFRYCYDDYGNTFISPNVFFYLL